MNYLLFFLFLTSALIAEVPHPIFLKQIALVDEESQKIIAHDAPISIALDAKTEEIENALRPYLGQPLEKEVLLNIKNSIYETLSQQETPLFVLEIPEQNISQGKLVIKAKKAKIKEIHIFGNEWNSAEDIETSLNLSVGDCVSEKRLLNSISWLNRNPFISSKIILSPGMSPFTSEVEIEAKDRFPARVFVGADNLGTSFAGNERFSTGVILNVRLKALLSYQFTSGFDFPEFLAHSGSLNVFLPWKHEVLLFGGAAKLHPHINNFESKGEAAQVSGRYIIPFKPLYTPFEQQLLFGADYKRTDSALFFLGASSQEALVRTLVSQKTANLFQFYLGYQLKRETKSHTFSFRWDTFFSPFQFLPNQTSSSFASLRPNAKTRYLYAKATFGVDYPFSNNYLFRFLLRGQVATGPLLPSEQMGLGGFETVRGYQEKVYLADQDLITNFEIYSLPFHILKSKEDSLRLLFFLDAAYGHNWQSSPSYPKDTWLIGIGPGLRYEIAPYLNLRADYGLKTHEPPFANGQIGRFHFAFLLGY